MLTRAREKEIIRKIRRRDVAQGFDWRTVTEMSVQVFPPNGFSRQTLSANSRIREAYLKRKNAARHTEARGAAARTSELERLRIRNAELRDEIADRDEQLAHFSEILVRMLRNAEDVGGMLREDLLRNLPSIHRLGQRSGATRSEHTRKKLRMPSAFMG